MVRWINVYILKSPANVDTEMHSPKLNYIEFVSQYFQKKYNIECSLSFTKIVSYICGPAWLTLTLCFYSIENVCENLLDSVKEIIVSLMMNRKLPLCDKAVSEARLCIYPCNQYILVRCMNNLKSSPNIETQMRERDPNWILQSSLVNVFWRKWFEYYSFQKLIIDFFK